MASAIFENSQQGQTSEREVPHVHDTRSPVHAHVLRALRAKAQASPDYKNELAHLVLGSLGQTFPVHAQIATHAVWLAHDLFLGTKFTTQTPLWATLVRSETGALRQVSKDWSENTNHLLGRLGLPSTSELIESGTSCPSLAYRLADNDLARKFLKIGRPLSIADSLLEIRIRISEGRLANDLLQEITQVSDKQGLRQSLLASYVVKADRLKTPMDSGLVPELQLWIEKASKKPSPDDEYRLRLCHVTNSINLHYFSTGRIDLVEKNFEILESLTWGIADNDKAMHAGGNLRYHKSILAAKNGDTDKEFELLDDAWRSDGHFADYAYRMAQILHDKGNANAGIYYQNALSTSPLFFSLVNDYGCFLNDFGMTEQLESWSKLAQWLAPIGSGIQV